MMVDSDDDTPQLSADTLAALQSFYSDRNAAAKQQESLERLVQDPNSILSMTMFPEDWNASQFWYSDETASKLARGLLSGCKAGDKIAVVAAPSVFIQLWNIMARNEAPRHEMILLEYDNKFAVLPQFHMYDFNTPFKLPADLKGQFDAVICDPPFLSEDCQTKAAMTARWLSKDESTRIVVCTGQTMSSVVTKVYKAVRETNYEPAHEGGRLSNKFRCYSNFECEDWKFYTS